MFSCDRDYAGVKQVDGGCDHGGAEKSPGAGLPRQYGPQLQVQALGSKTAQKILTPMMEYVNILITTSGDTRTILGIEAQNDDKLAQILLERFPLDVVAISFREGASVWQCRWSALARTPEAAYTTRTFEIDIVDQVGRGDSFAAGFLYGCLSADDIQMALDYGVAFAALKHSFPGDFNWCTRDEVEALLSGPRPGVSR